MHRFVDSIPTNKDEKVLAEFIAERDAALLSLDEARIRAFMLKFNEQEAPADPLVFWGSVHKAITGCLSLPIEFRRKSKAWLTEHELNSLDDGDL